MREKPLGSPSVPTHPIFRHEGHFDQYRRAVKVGGSPSVVVSNDNAVWQLKW